MKRGFVAFAFALALATQPVLAARIYNLTPVPLHVQGGVYNLWIQSGGRSESLSWKTNTVYVKDNQGRTLCTLYFGIYKEVTGGQYMLVAHHGSRVNCSMCDGDGKLMVSASGEFAAQYAQAVGNKKSDKWSCP